MWVLVPTDEILSFASPSDMDVVNAENAGAQSAKESVQRMVAPDAACSLRSVVFIGVCQKELPCPSGKVRLPAAPLRAIPDKTTNVRRGMTGKGAILDRENVRIRL
ncbi:MAG: hypothetical protein ABL884_13320 [Methyloglobulus sp.]